MGYATLYRNFLGGQGPLISPRPSGLLRLGELADGISQGDSWSRCPLRETLASKKSTYGILHVNRRKFPSIR